MLDLSYFFNKIAGDASVPIIADKSTGTHTLLLVDLAFLSSAPQSRTQPENGVRIDALDRGFIQWITVGGVKLDLAGGGPVTGTALEACYETTNAFRC